MKRPHDRHRVNVHHTPILKLFTRVVPTRPVETNERLPHPSTRGRARVPHSYTRRHVRRREGASARPRVSSLARSRRLFYRRARRRASFSSSRASMETTRCDATRSTPSPRSTIDRSRWMIVDRSGSARVPRARRSRPSSAPTDEKNIPVVSSSSQTVELTARTALAGDFRKATAPRAAAKVRHPFAHSFVTQRARASERLTTRTNARSIPTGERERGHRGQG